MSNARHSFKYILKAVRHNAGLSQEELAQKTGLKAAAISHFETGQRLPSLDNLVKLCRALRVSANVLLDLDFKP